MKSMSRQTLFHRFRFGWLVVLCLSLHIGGHVAAQQREGHPRVGTPTSQLFPTGLPTGYVGQAALLQPLPMQGYYQPVKVILPEGTSVAFPTNNTLIVPKEAPVQVGLLVGRVYRFQITQIPFYGGSELYPTLEIVNRLYPPPGKEQEFPVEVEITQDDLEIALSGRLVTRVIYLEDPQFALATKGEDKASLSLTIAPGENPLTEAQRMGRPMAILRMGNRQFVPDDNIAAFFFGSPPWLGPVVPPFVAQSLLVQQVGYESQSK